MKTAIDSNQIRRPVSDVSGGVKNHFNLVPTQALLMLLLFSSIGIQGFSINIPIVETDPVLSCIPVITGGSPCSDTNTSSISGKLQYDNEEHTPLINSTVYLKTGSGVITDSTITDLYGNYKFCNVQNGVYTVTAITNIPTGGINNADALISLRFFIGFTMLEGLRIQAADINNSGYVNSSDALLIQKKFVGMIEDFPGNRWIAEEKSVSISDSSAQIVNLKIICKGDDNGDYVPPVVNQACPGIQSLDYQGKIYTTIQIGNQCWLKENLNVGVMIVNDSSQKNNGVVEKYCYDDDSVNCALYGGLYQWDEMMAYSDNSGGQGICPSEWHIPTDEEWCTMSKSIDYRVNCESLGWEGATAGLTLKVADSSQWHSATSSTNQSGFSALGSGYRNIHKVFRNTGYYALFWTSSRNAELNPWYRSLYTFGDGIYRYNTFKDHGFSVRCVKN
ncbi:MAG: hypothetical protein NTU44_10135 [Bacteroidetes bacterium]|nr:hypothetical protein [Bacteroidota bacterium]